MSVHRQRPSLRLGSLLFAALGACARHSLPAPTSTPEAQLRIPPAQVPYRVVDATGPFWTFWEKASLAPPAEQPGLFRSIVVAAHPELFRPEVIGTDPTKRGEDLDDRLRAYLPTLAPRVAAMRKLTDAIHRDLPAFDSSFRAAFPDMRWDGTVYFTISVDSFNGGVRPVDGKPSLLFGIDRIAALSGENADLGVLVHHELFHVYQSSLDPDRPADDHGPVWSALWDEGAAVYVSKRLHPGATWDQLMIYEDVAREASAKLPALARIFRAKLDDASDETYRDFFLQAGRRPDVPKRAGYYLGLRVAELVGRTTSMPAMARLRGPDVRRLVDEALADLEGPRGP